MFDSLLMEEFDLLEFTNFELSQKQSFNYFGDIITESDMMISVYENQIFLEEQNREIFSYLKYGIIQEGAIAKIIDTIKAFFKKIKELIMKFINYITSKFKKKESEEINIDDIDDDKLDNLELKQCIIGDQSKNVLAEFDKNIKSLSDHFKESMNEVIDMVNSRKTFNIDEFTETTEAFEIAIKNITEASKQVYIGEKVKYKEIKSKINELKSIYEKYNKNMGSYIKEFKDISDKYIKDAESKFNSLKLLDKGEDPQYTKCISQASRITSLYYSYINNAISFICRVESVFAQYKVNLRKISKIQDK